MTDHPINADIVDNVKVPKADLRGYIKDRVRLRVASAAEVNSNNYSDAFGIDLGGVPYDRDTGDTTTADDAGVSCVVDLIGTRFKRDDIVDDVAFTHTGTGAVAATLKTRANYTVHVRDFGAVPSITTDNTTHIQAAIDYAQTIVGGALVDFGNGTYCVSTLTVAPSAYPLTLHIPGRLLLNSTTAHGVIVGIPSPVFTATISDGSGAAGNRMVVSAIVSGGNNIQIGTHVRWGSSSGNNAVITSQLSGTAGGVGTYTIDSAAFNVSSSTTMTSQNTIEEFKITGGGTIWPKSGVTKTGGAAILLYNARNSSLNVNCGSRLLSWTDGYILYDGVVAVGFNDVGFRGRIYGCTNDGIRLYSSGDTSVPYAEFAADFDIDGQVNNCGVGVRLAGACGGPSLNRLSIGGCGIGLVLDKSSYPKANIQCFTGPKCYIDSSTSYGVYVAADSLAGTGGLFKASGTWICSGGNSAVYVDASQLSGATFMFNDCYVIDNYYHGLHLLAGTISVNGGKYYQNGTAGSGQGSGILLFGGNIIYAMIASIISDWNSAYGVDNQSTTSDSVYYGPLIALNNTSGAVRNLTAGSKGTPYS